METTNEPSLSAESRASALIDQLNAEPRETPVLESDAAPAQAAPAPVAETKEERKDRLSRAAAIERDAARKRAELSQREAAFAKREAEHAAQAKRFERMARAEADPEALLELLSERVPAERMAEFILAAREPGRLAAQGAEARYTQQIQALQNEIKALRAETLERPQEASREREAEELFAKSVTEGAAKYPHLANRLAKQRDRVLQMGHAQARLFQSQGKAFTLEMIAQSIENELSEFYDGYEPSKVSANAPARAKPSLTNQTASARSSLLSEEEEDLSLDERARRLEQRLRAG